MTDLLALFETQRAAQASRRRDFDLRARLAALDALRRAVLRHQPQIIAALAADFAKPEPEVLLTEVLPVLQEISHTRRHLRRWMRARRVWPTLTTLGTSGRVQAEPRGQVLIIAPWNYPLVLALGPLVSALAAGNSAIVKPSELAPATSAVLKQMLTEAFPADLVAVVEGGVEVATDLLALAFDHIFFTGSPAVGKIVMAAAAQTLASVTLELGGKSPVIVGPGADVAKAARHIAWGKFANTGQTCIAPDHVFVHHSLIEPITQALRAEIVRLYGPDPAVSRHFGRMISQRHTERLHSLLSEARAAGAEVLDGGGIDVAQRYIAPTLIAKTRPDMAISQQELFGPVLPLIGYADVAEVIARINAAPKPLALYIFDRSTGFADSIIRQTSSGSVAVNVVLMQFLHPNLPFGGVGNSGIGAAHGHAGFLAFSHEKPILINRFSVLPLLFPPYTARVKRLVGWLLRLVQ